MSIPPCLYPLLIVAGIILLVFAFCQGPATIERWKREWRERQERKDQKPKTF